MAKTLEGVMEQDLYPSLHRPTTIEDVIARARERSGSKSVHLSVVPGADPAEVEAELLRMEASIAHYESFPAIAREKAFNARLLGKLREVRALSAFRADADLEALQQKLRDIGNAADMIFSADIGKDVQWMEEQGYAPKAVDAAVVDV